MVQSDVKKQKEQLIEKLILKWYNEKRLQVVLSTLNHIMTYNSESIEIDIYGYKMLVSVDKYLSQDTTVVLRNRLKKLSKNNLEKIWFNAI